MTVRLLCCLHIILHRMSRKKRPMPESSMSGVKMFARMRAYFSINYRASEPGVLVDQIRPEWCHLSPGFSSRRRSGLSIRRRRRARSTRDRRSPDIRSSRSRKPSNRPNTSPDLSALDSPTRSACPRVKWRYVYSIVEFRRGTRSVCPNLWKPGTYAVNEQSAK